MPLTRLPACLAIVAVLALLTSCGSTDKADTDDPATESSTQGAFPVTLENRFGSTTIDAEPERIVTVGWNDQDFVLALGVVPVSIRDWFEEYATYPWVTEVTGGAELSTFGDEIDYEKIAAARPDVILALATWDEISEKTYEKLSAIAPTVLQPTEYGTDALPWDVQTRITGQVLGLEDEADALVTKVEDRIDEVKSDHPEFAGQTLVVDYGPSDEGHWLVPAGDPRRALFDALGFEAQEHEGDLSTERLDLLDEDVLVVFGALPDDLAGDRSFTSLDVVSEGRTVYISWDSTLAGAMSFSGPQALLYALDQIAPQLANAADGDPGTKVDVFEAAA